MTEELIVTEMTPPKLEDMQSRLTVILTVHHELYGEQPSSLGPRYSVPLESREQPYSRRLTVKETWSPLDVGWVETPGVIVIENRAGMVLLTNPTEEEKADLAKQVVLVSSSLSEEASFVVRPGQFILFEPKDATKFSIRSESGKPTIQLTVFPR